MVSADDIILYDRPVNPGSSLSQSLFSWWLALPNLSGGQYLYDLMGMNRGTLMGAPAWSKPIQNGGAASLKFSGSQQVTPTFQPSGGVFSIFTWIILSTIPGSGTYTTIYADNTRGFWLRSLGGSSVLQWYEGGNRAAGSTGLVAGVPYHIGYTCDGTTLTGYVNGVPDSSQAFAAGLPNTGTLGIGGHSAEYFLGQMDDIALYTNRCLSPAAAFAFYNDSRTGYPERLTRVKSTALSGPTGTSTVGKDDKLVWNARALINKLDQMIWNVRTTAGKSSIDLWNARAIAGKSSVDLWNVRTATGKSSIDLWNARAIAGKSSIDLWNVNSLISHIGQTIQLVWDVMPAVKWNVHSLAVQARQTIRPLASFPWNARSLIGKK